MSVKQSTLSNNTDLSQTHSQAKAQSHKSNSPKKNLQIRPGKDSSSTSKKHNFVNQNDSHSNQKSMSGLEQNHCANTEEIAQVSTSMIHNGNLFGLQNQLLLNKFEDINKAQQFHSQYPLSYSNEYSDQNLIAQSQQHQQNFNPLHGQYKSMTPQKTQVKYNPYASLNMSTNDRSPQSDAQHNQLNSELFSQFESFKQIDELVSKQGKIRKAQFYLEELYNQIANIQQSRMENRQSLQAFTQNNKNSMDLSNAYDDGPAGPSEVARKNEKSQPTHQKHSLSDAKISKQNGAIKPQHKTRNITQTNYSQAMINQTPRVPSQYGNNNLVNPYPHTIASIPYDNIHHQTSNSLQTLSSASQMMLVNDTQAQHAQQALMQSSISSNQSQLHSLNSFPTPNEFNHQKLKQGQSPLINIEEEESKNGQSNKISPQKKSVFAKNNTSGKNIPASLVNLKANDFFQQHELEIERMNQMLGIQQNQARAVLTQNSQGDSSWFGSYSANQSPSKDQRNSTDMYQLQNEQHNAKKQLKQEALTQRAIKAAEVTDRLLTIGKLYQEKKEKMRKENMSRKQLEEDLIVFEIKRKYSRENLHSQNQSKLQNGSTNHSKKSSQLIGGAPNQNLSSNELPVEVRLNQQKRKYDANAELRKKQQILEEMAQFKQNPLVNAKSLKMLENSSYHHKKVEDRLIEMGEKWKQKKEQKYEEYIEKVDTRAHPVLNNTINNKIVSQANSNYALVQKSPRKNKVDHQKQQQIDKNCELGPRNFEERLKRQMQKKEQMLEELKRKYEEEKLQRPVIGAQQVDPLQFEKISLEFEERQKQFNQAKKQHKEIILIEEQSRFPFQPAINRNSRKMVSSSSQDRLLSRTPSRSKHVNCKRDRFSKSPKVTKSQLNIGQHNHHQYQQQHFSNLNHVIKEGVIFGGNSNNEMDRDSLLKRLQSESSQHLLNLQTQNSHSNLSSIQRQLDNQFHSSPSRAMNFYEDQNMNSLNFDHQNQLKTDRSSAAPSQGLTHSQHTVKQRFRSKTPTSHDKERQSQGSKAFSSSQNEERVFCFHPKINEKSKKIAERQVIQAMQQQIQSIQHNQQHHQSLQLENAMTMRSGGGQPLNINLTADQEQQQVFQSVLSSNSNNLIMSSNNNNFQTHQSVLGVEPRWKYLYQKHFEIQQHKQEVKNQVEQYKTLQEQEVCTFKPNIQETSWIHEHLGQVAELPKRTLLWKQNKISKIEQMNEVQAKEELEHCTFKPQTLKVNNLDQILQADYSQLNTKSIEKFLERQTYAKQLKLESELRQENKFGSGNKWKNSITVAREPSFMREYYQQLRDQSPQSLSPNKMAGVSQRGSASKIAKVRNPNNDISSLIKQNINFDDQANQYYQPWIGADSSHQTQQLSFNQPQPLLQTINEETELNSQNITSLLQTESQQQHNKYTHSQIQHTPLQFQASLPTIVSQSESSYLDMPLQISHKQSEPQFNEFQNLANYSHIIPETFKQQVQQEQSSNSLNYPDHKEQESFYHNAYGSLMQGIGVGDQNSMRKIQPQASAPNNISFQDQQNFTLNQIGASNHNSAHSQIVKSRKQSGSANVSSSASAPSQIDEKEQYSQAMNFLHEQLHKIEFSFDNNETS